MEPVALLDRARHAGLVVLREGDRLMVRGPKRLADLAVHLLDRKAEGPAAPDGEAAPAGATGPDQDGAAPPTAPCRCCGATAWHRAGGGWACARCHPPPHTTPVALTDTALDI